MVFHNDGHIEFILGETSTWRLIPSKSRATRRWFNYVPKDDKGKTQPAHWDCGYTRPNYVFSIKMWYVNGPDSFNLNWNLSPDLVPAAYRHEHLHSEVTINYLMSTVGVYERKVGEIRNSFTTKAGCQLQIDDELTVVNKEYDAMNQEGSLWRHYEDDQAKIDKKDTVTYIQPPNVTDPWTITPDKRIDPTSLYFYLPHLIEW